MANGLEMPVLHPNGVLVVGVLRLAFEVDLFAGLYGDMAVRRTDDLGLDLAKKLNVGGGIGLWHGCFPAVAYDGKWESDHVCPSFGEVVFVCPKDNTGVGQIPSNPTDVQRSGKRQ
jgi:hypothetical protein